MDFTELVQESHLHSHTQKNTTNNNDNEHNNNSERGAIWSLELLLSYFKYPYFNENYDMQ